MRRFASAAFALALIATLVLALAFLVGDSRAELENQVFTSRADKLRMVVPRGWRATDQPSYPGLLLWMMRTLPPGQIVLTSETFTRELYCSWPVSCRTTQESSSAKYACAVREKLAAQRIRVGPAQPGPKENDEAGLPTVWFEYDDGKRFLRQAIGVTNDRAVSLVLSAPTNEARATHVRPFDQALRTLHPLTAAETAQAQSRDGGITMLDAGAVVDAAPMLVDASVQDAGVVFESAPSSKQNPIGPCPK
jgi:hypothetical protein